MLRYAMTKNVTAIVICFLCWSTLAAADETPENDDVLNNSVDKPGVSPTWSDQSADTSDVFTSTEDYLTRNVYPVETHTVTTEDGYLLKMFRIPGSPKASRAGVGTPVVLQHGILSNSDDWVLRGPDHGLGFQLADQGYDVWLNNARGNHYSRNHTTLSTRDPRFWNFTWHEMGVYDLPAVIDYILAATNHTQLFYIGHSMGTTMFFVMASTRPEYNQKIRLMVALAPVVYFTGGVRSKQLSGALPLAPVLYKVLQRSGIYELFPPNKSLFRLVHQLCKDGQATQVLCIQFLSDFAGENAAQFNTTLTTLYITHMLDTISLGMFFHYVQAVQTGRFQVYDPTNQEGREMPEYDLSKVTCPVNLVYALNDNVVDPQDVLKLSKSISSEVQLTQVTDKRATHIDLICSNDVKTLVNDGIIDVFEKYNTKRRQ